MYLFLPNTPATRCVNSNFTFHNVSISTEQRCWPLRLLILYIPQCIYFYIYLCNCQYCNRPLHSTMYLFLPCSPHTMLHRKKLYIPQCIYFYPIILRLSFYDPALHSTMYLFLRKLRRTSGSFLFFTFHNVSISTNTELLLKVMKKLLYIPQCIYFYPDHLFHVFLGILPLHSTMYLFLRPPTRGRRLIGKCFTFHNVSIST